MSDKEVHLGDEDYEDYEVMPVGPLRKLEKRVDKLQKEATQGGGAANEEMVQDIIDIMKSNQKIVNDMTESTHELKNSVEDLTHKMDQVVDNMNNFMDLLKEASEVDMEGEVVSDIHDRIADAVGNEMRDVASDIENSNKEVVEGLNQIDQSLRRIYSSGMAQPPQQGGQQGGQQETQRTAGGQSSEENVGSSLGSEESERLQRLREKFDQGSQNEQ
ncbi:MAG: hypothetical protein ABEK01_02610 [Candidatus Nanohaloarchaea archaeon]